MQINIVLLTTLIITNFISLQALSTQEASSRRQSVTSSHSAKPKFTSNEQSNYLYAMAALTQLEKKEAADREKYNRLSRKKQMQYTHIINRIDIIERRRPQSYEIILLSAKAERILNRKQPKTLSIDKLT